MVSVATKNVEKLNSKFKIITTFLRKNEKNFT